MEKVEKVKKVKCLLVLAFSLAMMTGNAQQVIYGKYKYMDSLTFATYKNNGSGDSVLSVDALVTWDETIIADQTIYISTTQAGIIFATLPGNNDNIYYTIK